jgi:hypothetical protein
MKRRKTYMHDGGLSFPAIAAESGIPNVNIYTWCADVSRQKILAAAASMRPAEQQMAVAQMTVGQRDVGMESDVPRKRVRMEVLHKNEAMPDVVDEASVLMPRFQKPQLIGDSDKASLDPLLFTLERRETQNSLESSRRTSRAEYSSSDR